MFMYPGLKYLRIGSKTQFKLDLEEKKRIKAENELLKSQVNPHFMFNTLNSIYSLIISEDKKSGEAVLKLSGLMRYMLENSKNKTVSLQQECDFLHNYIDLERIRLNDRCEIKFEFTGNFEGKNISPMLFIPFVENAFKHGISAQSNMNYIKILMNSENKEVSLHVENRIAPASNISAQKQNKIGIDNVTQRLDLLYPEKHKLQISEEDGIYIIDLRILL
ncbi:MULTISPECIES: sensor histidine kinase [unclassified Lentimicrobium]|uniref:sensor histidine kinase n=1 Tax=unclassified Lentimicrobium TaxID=2677434 RepID=UPI001555CE38|nr:MULTISPECIES: histidine kinase [unclassified Lentimicrobium]NPD47360.1 histidine kinase [Lentimicrobium sp. S6]NPD85456.1 histidine kinase [Lentimicrobium sp. L6]